MTDCEHKRDPFFAIPIIKRPRGYTKCRKCGEIRHEEDGHIIKKGQSPYQKDHCPKCELVPEKFKDECYRKKGVSAK